MIAKLSGHVDSIERDHLIVMVGGIGYVLWCSNKTLSRFMDRGEPITLWVEHIFRQENQQLCGFANIEERACFRALMDVQGVGVRVALAILSVFTPSELGKAIHHQDKTLLTRAEGVGPKLAGRLVLELKDKAFQFTDHLSASNQTFESSSIQDALSGLLSLGYGRSEAMSVLERLTAHHNDVSTEDLIRLSLQNLVRI